MRGLDGRWLSTAMNVAASPFTQKTHTALRVMEEHLRVHVLVNHKQQALYTKCPLSVSTVIENTGLALHITDRKRRILKPIT